LEYSQKALDHIPQLYDLKISEATRECAKDYLKLGKN
jgi:hypothetical protein